MPSIRKTVIVTRILLLAGGHFATPAAAAGFDGASVSIGINNGQVASNNATVTASGHVAEAGSIRVTLISGIKRAVGSGHLAGTSGSGTWRGPLCSGTWTAQRI
jgi:hypothetical protein